MVKVVINSHVRSGDKDSESVFEKHDVAFTKNKDEYRNYEDSYRHDIVFNRKMDAHYVMLLLFVS